MASNRRRTQRQEIRFPLGGFSENNSYSDQDPFTCRDELNVRSIDPVTGRTRGAQRAGLGVYAGAAQLDGANKIQAMASVAVDKTQLIWSAAVSNDWEVGLTPGQGAVADIAQDHYGNIYVLGSDDAVFKFNEDGGLIATMEIPADVSGTSSAPLVCVAVDEFQNVFVGRGCGSDSAVTEGRIYAFEYKMDSTYGIVWSGGAGVYIQDIVIFEGDLIIAASAAAGSGTAIYLRVFPGYSMLKAPSIDGDKTWTGTVTIDGSGGTETVRHQRLALRDDGIVYMSVCGINTATTLVQNYGRVVKINPYSADPSTAVWDTINDGDVGGLAGIGLGIAIGPTADNGDRSIYTTGNDIRDNSTDANVRRIVDLGATNSGATVSGDGWLKDWGGDGFNKAGTTGNQRQRIATDEDDRLYVPFGITDSSSSFNGVSFVVYDVDGDVADGLGGITDSASSANTVNAAITVQAKKPDYDRANALGGGTATIRCVEWVVFGGTADDDGNLLWRTRMAVASQDSGVGQTRTLKVLAASNGTFKTVDTAEFDAVVTGTYDENAPYVQMVQAFSKVYITDGRNYYVYDPAFVNEDGTTSGTVSPWMSTSVGSIPPRCRLIEVWRGRMVVARNPEDPSDWAMSAIFQPDNWDQFPQVVSAAQAISAENSRAGKVPDVVNTIIPYNDDLCIFGGDHSIWRLTGDPMAGGQLDLVTDETGISFGRPWVKDPMGRLWFIGSRGSLYLMTGTGQLERISEHRVSRSLQDIDFSAYYVQLVWNYIDEGLHIFVLPFGAGGAIVNHWFFDVKNKAFHKDNFGSVATDLIQPTAALQVDGDDYDDRVVMLGCEDGRVRRWGKNQAGTAMPYSDQKNVSTNLAIDSFATIGPIAPVDTAEETQITEFNVVLADDQDGCNYEFFVTGSPDTLGLPKAQGGLIAGRNPTKLVRMSGDSIYLRMRNGNAEQRWALEKASALMSTAGAKRSR